MTNSFSFLAWLRLSNGRHDVWMFLDVNLWYFLASPSSCFRNECTETLPNIIHSGLWATKWAKRKNWKRLSLSSGTRMISESRKSQIRLYLARLLMHVQGWNCLLLSLLLSPLILLSEISVKLSLCPETCSSLRINFIIFSAGFMLYDALRFRSCSNWIFAQQN